MTRTATRPRMAAIYAPGTVRARRWHGDGDVRGYRPPPGWTARADGDDTPRAAPLSADWIAAGGITHVFTHFELRLSVYRAAVPDFAPPPGHRWARLDDIHDEALPTVMKKAIEAAIPGATRKRRSQG